jgi:hypothetical protein
MIGLSLLLLVPAAGLAGCSRFNRDWRAAQPAAPPASGIDGPWQGTWLSAANGHQGQLRAILTRTGEDTYHARFRARFWGVLAYSYSLNLEVQPATHGYWRLEGGADLGRLAGGRYECRGTASTHELFATYESKRDRGRFSLSRPSNP